MSTPAVALSLVQQVVAARVEALTHLPHLQVRLHPGLRHTWQTACCCQTLYVATDQPTDDLLQAMLDGVADMVGRSHRADIACPHHDELADRRRTRTG